MAQPLGMTPSVRPTTTAPGDGQARDDDGDRSREPNRDRILAVALDEFANKGYEGTTTAEIARRAEVTQPLVHYHFDSKDELWRAALRSALDQLQASFGVSPSELSDLDPVTKLKVLVRRFVHFSAAHPELGRIMAYEGANGGERLRWLLGQEAIGQLGLFTGLLDDAAGQGLVKPLPGAHVAICLGAAAAYIFVVRQTMVDAYGIDVTDPDVVDRHADTVVEVFFHGLVQPVPAGVAR